jgi:hypothetical protein
MRGRHSPSLFYSETKRGEQKNEGLSVDKCVDALKGTHRATTATRLLIMTAHRKVGGKSELARCVCAGDSTWSREVVRVGFPSLEANEKNN